MKRFVWCAVTVVAMLAVAAGAWAIDAKTALDNDRLVTGPSERGARRAVRLVAAAGLRRSPG